MEIKTFLQKLKKGEIPLASLLRGEESTLEGLLAPLRKASSFQYQEFRGEVSLEEVIRRAESNLFAEKRVLVARETPWLLGKEISPAEEEMLSRYLRQPEPLTFLLFVAGKEAPDSGKLVRLFKAHAALFDFSPLKGESLKKWLAARAKARGKEISAAALDYLLSFGEEDPQVLAQEIEKAALFVGRKSQIDLASVQAVLAGEKKPKVFKFLDAVGRKQKEAALLLLRELAETKEPPLLLLSLLARQFRLIYQAKLLLASGKEIAASLSVPSFTARALARQAESYTFPELAQVFDRLMATDLALKTGAPNPYFLLQDFLLALPPRKPKTPGV